MLYLLVFQHAVTRFSGQWPGWVGEEAHLHNLWMKAVWTFGWWTAGAVTAGAGMVLSWDGCSCCGVGGCSRSLVVPLILTSRSGLLVAEAGADEPVGVVMSMGSPGDGVDIWMVGAIIGMVLTPIDDSEGSVEWILGALSVAAAICPIHLTSDSVSNVNSEKEQKKPKTGGWACRDRGGGACAAADCALSRRQCNASQKQAARRRNRGASKQATTTLKEDLTGAYLSSLLHTMRGFVDLRAGKSR